MPSAVSRRNMGEPRYRWWWHFQRIVWTPIGFISLWKVGNVTSTTETWNQEAEMAARSEIWQVLSNIWSTRNANLSDVNEWSCFKGENAGNPRSGCCLRNFPAASWLCRSHRIPPQVDLRWRFLEFVFFLVWLRDDYESDDEQETSGGSPLWRSPQRFQWSESPFLRRQVTTHRETGESPSCKKISKLKHHPQY